MTQGTGSFKKVAVLTGLTMLVGGAEISEAEAATTTPEAVTFFLTSNFGGTVPDNLQFQQFDASLGTLTGVQFSLDSEINGGSSETVSASITVNSVVLSSATLTGTYDDPTINGLNGAANAAFYTGTGNFFVALSFAGNCECTATWDGQNSAETGLTLTYDYTPATSATPLPGALPLFATGLAGLGVMTWRSRRKQKTAEQS